MNDWYVILPNIRNKDIWQISYAIPLSNSENNYKNSKNDIKMIEKFVERQSVRKDLVYRRKENQLSTRQCFTAHKEILWNGQIEGNIIYFHTSKDFYMDTGLLKEISGTEEIVMGPQIKKISRLFLIFYKILENNFLTPRAYVHWEKSLGQMYWNKSRL